jgi:hypothetical protein
MIVTINSEIKLSNGDTLVSGTKITATEITQFLKGGPVDIYPADEFLPVYRVNTDDLEKITITPELLTKEQKNMLREYVAIGEKLNRIARSI